MQTITATGVTGGSVTVNLGGFGGDNATGTVTDPDGNVVTGATVTVVNATENEQGTDTTNSSGEYDIDIDGNVGDSLIVTAEWEDSSGRTHVVRGTVVIAQSDVLRPASRAREAEKGKDKSLT